MQIQSRSYTAPDKSYRYGFNGQEYDHQIMGYGHCLNFGSRVFDSRLCKWLSVDPKAIKYPGFSTYGFAGNRPIISIDVDGKDYEIIIDKTNKTITIKATYYVDTKAASDRTTKAVSQLASENGTYSFKTNDGDLYKIEFELDVQMEPDARRSGSANDDAGNHVDILSNTVYDDLRKRNNEPESNGVTNHGGDDIQLRETHHKNGSVINTAKHEFFHSLGANHNSNKPGNGKVTKRVLKAILHGANLNSQQSGGNCSIDVKGAKDEDTHEGDGVSDSPLVGFDKRPPKSDITFKNSSDLTLKGKIIITPNEPTEQSTQISPTQDIVELENGF